MAKNKSKDKEHKEHREKVEAGPLLAHERWLGLLVTGDYRSVRAEATKALKDPAATERDKAAAREVLERTGLDRGTLAVGLVGLAILLVIFALVFL